MRWTWHDRYHPSCKIDEITIKNNSKIVCYTDGLSELKGEDGKDIGTKVIIRNISNTDPVDKNIIKMISELKLPHGNTSVFDDVSIIAADLKR